MFLPGDWHTGMNMLQSIHNLFWSDLLKPFRDLLGWKCIAKDVHACYFQALQLVKYVNDVVILYLVRSFMSRYYETNADNMMDDEPANVFCLIAVDFQSFLTPSLWLKDEYLKLIVNLLVSSDNLKFVASY